MKRIHLFGVIGLLFSAQAFATNNANQDIVCSLKSNDTLVNTKIRFSKSDDKYSQNFYIFDKATSGFTLSFVRLINPLDSKLEDQVAITINSSPNVTLYSSDFNISNGKLAPSKTGPAIEMFVSSEVKSMQTTGATFSVSKNASLSSDLIISCKLLDKASSAGGVSGPVPVVTTIIAQPKLTADSAKVDNSSSIPTKRSAIDIVRHFGDKVGTASTPK
jgi:hypothetical protein